MSNSVGITGSLLVASHRADSDIDLVTYDEPASNQAQQARDALQLLIRGGVFKALDDDALADAYRRRGCTLDHQTFRWHEARRIAVQGQLEQAADGKQQIIVGSDRESTGQCIRVLAR